MALTATLLEMRNRVRQVTDQEQSTFVSDGELNSWINQGIREVWRLLVTHDSDRGLTSTTLATTTGTTEYALPADFQAFRGLDYPVTGSVTVDVEPYQFLERNRIANATYLGTVGAPCRYHVQYGSVDGTGVRLSLLPDPTTATYTVWYVAVPTALSADGDTFDGIIGFDDYPVYWAAIQVRAKAEEDASSEAGIVSAVTERIKQEAPRRNRSGIETIARIRGRRFGHYPYPGV